MKSLIFIFTFFACSTMNQPASQDEFEQVINAVKEFADAADQRDADRLDKIMHKDYRSVVNRLFGSAEVSIMNKTLYLDLLKKGKIGGDQRSVNINSVNVIGNNAVVNVSLTGKELVFHSFMQLVKAPSGEWLVISDMPDIKKQG